METARKITLIRHWALVTAGGIALFWGCWYYFAGSVPKTVTIQISSLLQIDLPFSVSRWWDIFIPLLWIIVFDKIFADETKEETDELIFALISGLALGTILAAFWWIIFYGQSFGPMVTNFFGLGLGASCGLAILATVDSEANENANVSLSSVVFLLAVGFVYSLLLGITHGIIFLLVVIIFGVAVAILSIVSGILDATSE